MARIAKHMKPKRIKSITDPRILNNVYIPQRKEYEMSRLEKLKKSFKAIRWYEWVMIAILIVITGLEMYMILAIPDGHPAAWLTILNVIITVCVDWYFLISLLRQ